MRRIKWLICLITILAFNSPYVYAEDVDSEHVHTYGDVETIIDGNVEKEIEVCTECGYINVLSEKEHTHIFSEWEITKEATVEEVGTKTRTCLVEGCDAIETMTYVKIRDMRMTYVFSAVILLMAIIIAIILFNKNKKNKK